MATSTNIAIRNAILSYPNIYTHELYQGQPTDNPQFSAVLLFDDQDTYDRIWELGMEIAAEEFGSEKKIPKNFQRSERLCISEISLSKEDDGIEFEGWAIKAKSGTTRSGAAKRVLTYDRDNNLVTEDDGEHDNGIFYPGCRVDAQISLWTSKKYPHLRSNLLLVRFTGDGEPLGGTGSGPSAADLLNDLGDAEADI